MFGSSAEDITDGPLSRALVFLAVPLLAQNVVRAAQQVVDLFWLGQFSGDAVAAMGLAAPIVSLLLAAVIAIPFVGTQVLVSQRVGGDEPDRAQRAAFAGLLVALVLGVVVGVVTFFGVDSFLAAFASVTPQGSSSAVSGLAAIYLEVFALGLVVAALGDVIEAAFIGWGNSRVALYMNVVAVLVNVLLDPVFIFGLGPAPALGMAGAALASVSGSAASLLLGVGFAASSRYETVVDRARATVHWPDVREVVDVGSPTAAQDVGQQLVRIAIVALIFTIGGAPALAAYIVGSRVGSIAFIPAHGLQQATQSVVGQNLGASQPERARRTVWLGVAFAGGILSLLAVAQWTFPEVVARVFIQASATESFELAVTYLRIFAIGYPAIGAIFLLQGGFNGARKTRVSFVSSVVQYWVVRLPAAAVAGLVLGSGVVTIFWVITASNLAVALGLGAYFYYVGRTGMMTRMSEEIASAPSAD